MNTFLALPDERKRLICEQTGSKLNLPDRTILKDFWVCWILAKLFNLSELGTSFTFKGGTSLSKGWQIIDRFSEDIDIVIDRGSLGFNNENSPAVGLSKSQNKRRLKKLRTSSRKYVRGTVQSLLATVISREMPDKSVWSLGPDETGKPGPKSNDRED